MKLSPAQRRHLTALKDSERSAYPGLTMGTLVALERKGLVAARRNVIGAMAFPSNAIKWRLTDAGREVLHNA